MIKQIPPASATSKSGFALFGSQVRKESRETTDRQGRDGETVQIRSGELGRLVGDETHGFGATRLNVPIIEYPNECYRSSRAGGYCALIGSRNVTTSPGSPSPSSIVP